MKNIHELVETKYYPNILLALTAKLERNPVVPRSRGGLEIKNLRQAVTLEPVAYLRQAVTLDPVDIQEYHWHWYKLGFRCSLDNRFNALALCCSVA